MNRPPSDLDSDLPIHIYTVELLVDTQFEYQLGIAKTLFDSKFKSIALKSVAYTPLDYLTLYPTFTLCGTLLRNPILGLWLKGDVC